MRCGELYAVEESRGAAGVEGVHGEGVDDGGEGELDGAVVAERVEVDGFAGVGGRQDGGASAGVPAVVAVVEVAEVLASEGWGFALAAVGLSVAA
jgi:hypothetical protein